LDVSIPHRDDAEVCGCLAIVRGGVESLQKELDLLKLRLITPADHSVRSLVRISINAGV
jgi:hypothetical protein